MISPELQKAKDNAYSIENMAKYKTAKCAGQWGTKEGEARQAAGSAFPR